MTTTHPHPIPTESVVGILKGTTLKKDERPDGIDEKEDTPLLDQASFADADETSSLLPPKTQAAALGPIGACFGLYLSNMTLCLPVIPSVVERDMDGAAAALFVGGLQAVGALFQLWLAPSAGIISDEVGRIPLIKIGLFSVLFDTAIRTIYPAVLSIALGSMATSIFAAGVLGGLSSMIIDVSLQTSGAVVTNVGRAFGVPLGCAFVFGPVVGGLLASVDHRLVFGLAFILGAVNLYIATNILQETCPKVERPQLTRELFFSRLDNPITSLKRNLELLQSRPVLRPLGMVLLLVWCSFAAYPVIFIYARDKYDWSPLMNGALLATLGFCLCLVMGGCAGWLDRKFGPKACMCSSLVAQVLMFTALGLSNHGWMLFVIVILFSPAHILLPTVRAMMAEQVTPAKQGHMNGTAESLGQLGLVIGPVILMPVYSTLGDPKDAQIFVHGIVFYVAAFILLLALLIAWWCSYAESWQDHWQVEELKQPTKSPGHTLGSLEEALPEDGQEGSPEHQDNQPSGSRTAV